MICCVRVETENSEKDEFQQVCHFHRKEKETKKPSEKQPIRRESHFYEGDSSSIHDNIRPHQHHLSD